MSLSRRTQITTATIKSLKPAGQEWFVRDTVQRGFQIKVPPTGNAVYQVEARLSGTGKVKKFKIANVVDLSLEEARERARVALDKIRSGTDPLLEKRASLHAGKTLAELIDLYVESKDLKDRTSTDYRKLAARRFRPWLDKRVTEITKHEIRDWYLNGRKRPTQTEQAYRFLSALMTFAMGMEIIKDHPCLLVKNSGVRYSIGKRTGHLEINNDLPKFLIALTNYKFGRDSEKVARDLIILILCTGLRSMEARSLTWESVDFKRKVVTITDTKNRRVHVVPMTPLTYGMFRYREANREGSDFVFRIKKTSKSGYITDFQKTLTNVCKAASVPNVRPHDLRRSFATVLNSIGIGYADTKQLMNHQARDITASIYIQPDIEKLRRILVQLTQFYDQQIPYFTARQGVSRFGVGVIRKKLYGSGDPSPVELDDPTEEDPEWIEAAEREFWEG